MLKNGFRVALSGRPGCSVQNRTIVHAERIEPTQALRISVEAAAGSVEVIVADGLVFQEPSDDLARSFVVVFGVCRRRGRGEVVTQSDLEEVLQGLRSGRRAELCELDGQFVLIAFDHLGERLWVWNDFWGIAGVFFGRRGPQTALGSQAAWVAATLRMGVNGHSLLAYVRRTAMPTGSTLFAGVRRFACGQICELNVGTGEGELRGAELGQVEAPVALSLAEHVERVAEALTAATSATQTAGTLSMDLTGGNDTRVLAACLEAAGSSTSVRFRVAGESESAPDVLIAREIAKQFGWRLERIPPSAALAVSLEDVEAAAARGDGMVSPIAFAKRWTQETHFGEGARNHVGGGAGELLRGFYWQQEFFGIGRRRDVDVKALLRHRIYRTAWVDARRISAGRVDEASHDRVLGKPTIEFSRLMQSARNTLRLDVIYIQKWMTNITWWPLYDRAGQVAPFLFKAVSDRILDVPWQLRMTRQFVTKLVERVSPKLCTIPTDSGAPFRPLGLSTIVPYGRYAVALIRDKARRHSRQVDRSGAEGQDPASRRLLFGMVENGGLRERGRWLWDPGPEIGRDNAKDFEFATSGQVREIEACYSLQCLRREFPGIDSALDWSEGEIGVQPRVVRLGGVVNALMR